MSARWEPAFVAVSAIVGVPTDEAAAALGPGGAANAEAVLAALRGGSREARARAIARPLADVAAAIDALRPA